VSAWPVVALSDVANLSSGGTPSKARADFWGGEIPWVSPKDMKSARIEDAAERITRDAVAGSAARIVGPDSVLAVVRSGILAHTFPVAIVGREVAFNQDIKAITPKNGNLLPSFVYWLLKSREIEVLKIGVKKGATVHSLSSGFLENLQFLLPPLREQQRIVSLLDRSAEIRGRAEAARVKARAIIPALFLDTFGDPATMLDRFDSAPLGRLIAERQLGLVRAARELSEAGDAFYLRMNSITGDGRVELRGLKRTTVSVSELRNNELLPGDLLFNTRNSRELVGKMGVFDGPAGVVFNNNILRLRFYPEIISNFVNWYFQTPPGQSVIEIIKKGTTTIYYRDLSQVVVPVPPLALQTACAKQAARIEGLARGLDAAVVKAQATAAALAAEVFD
jgi:restriction endonuclease S subunit